MQASAQGRFIVYCVTHAPDQKRYVGITRRKLGARWLEHLSHARQPRPTFRLHLAMAKHGANAFAPEVLEEVEGQGAANDAESWWVEHFGSDDPSLGYNGTKGGDGPGSIGDETRRRMSEAAKARKAAQTPEERRAISLKGRAKAVATMAAKTQEERAATATKKSASLRAAHERRAAGLTPRQPTP